MFNIEKLFKKKQTLGPSLLADSDEAFQETGLPTKREEEWRYIDLQNLLKKDFQFVEPDLSVSDKILNLADDSRFVFNNGKFIDEQSITFKAEGILICPFSQLTEEKLKTIGWDRKRLTDFFKVLETDHGFSRANIALAAEGLFIFVGKGVEVEKTIRLYNTSSPGAAIALKSLIYLESGALLNYSELHQGKGSAFKSVATDVYLEDRATLNSLCVQDEDIESFHFSSSKFHLQQESVLNSFYLSMGGEISRQDICINHEGEKAEAHLHGAYLAKSSQQLSIFSKMRHQKAQGLSRQSFKGILADTSRVVFNGQVYIAPQAQKVDSDQQNKSLLLGETAEIDSKPELEVYADDVKATHGATVGQLDEEELFYLQARAIPKDQAIAMLSRGFVQDNIKFIINEGLKDLAQEHLAQRAPIFFDGVQQ